MNSQLDADLQAMLLPGHTNLDSYSVYRVQAERISGDEGKAFFDGSVACLSGFDDELLGSEMASLVTILARTELLAKPIPEYMDNYLGYVSHFCMCAKQMGHPSPKDLAEVAIELGRLLEAHFTVMQRASKAQEN